MQLDINAAFTIEQNVNNATNLPSKKHIPIRSDVQSKKIIKHGTRKHCIGCLTHIRIRLNQFVTTSFTLV